MKPYEIKKILVPIDFSKVSLNALDIAISLSCNQQAELMLINVIENTHTLLPPEAGGFTNSFLSELISSCDKKLSELCRELSATHNMVVSNVTQLGNPADEICRVALQAGIDLIIMGTHGVSGLYEFFLGSNAYSVVKNAPCPVITVPITNRWKDLKKILFPIRMVPNALDKYDVVRPIIRRNGSSVLIAGIAKKNDSSNLVEMRALTEYVKVKMEEDDVICGCEVHYTENVANHVLDVSNVEKPDLIVITATMDESLQDVLFGSYTQHIVNHSHFPVLSTRPGVNGESVGILSKSIIDALDGLYQH